MSKLPPYLWINCLLLVAILVGTARLYRPGEAAGPLTSGPGPAGPAPGPARPAPGAAGASAKAQEVLRTLPYTSWKKTTQEGRGKQGVTLHLPQKAQAGLNFFSLDDYPEVYLMDMDGKVVHTWRSKVGLNHAELLPDGSILAIGSDGGLFKIGHDSRLRWSRKGFFHHDLDLVPGQGIFIISGKEERGAPLDNLGPYVDEFVVQLSEDGQEMREISLGRMLIKARLHEDKQIKALLARENDRDLLHANTIEVFRQEVRLGSRVIFEQDQVLVCLRDLNLVAVVDLQQQALVWWWGIQELDLPHDPSLTPSKTLLVFDNRVDDEASRVVEVDLQTKKILWQYPAQPSKAKFFSETKGNAQRLPNGNTLIASAEQGKAFEVTPEGEVVWRYYTTLFNPEGTLRKSLWRLTRVGLQDGKYFILR